MKYTQPTEIVFNSHKNHNPYCDIVVKQVDKDTSITFGIYIKDGDKHKKGDKFLELYIGENYNVESTKKSYSRIYVYPNIPKKHINTWIELKNIYVEKYL